MTLESIMQLSTSVFDIVDGYRPHVLLSRYCSGAGGGPVGGGADAGGGGGTAVADVGAGGGGGDAGAGGGGGGDAGGGDPGGGGGTGDAESDFLNDAAADDAPVTTDDTTTTTTDDTTGTGEEIDPATGEPKPKPIEVLTPEQQEQQRVEDETLKNFYAETPALKEFLKANPTARAQFFKAAQINQIYTSVEDAQMAAEYAQELSSFDRLYTSPRPEDTKGFVDSLWKNSLNDPEKPWHPQANPSKGNFERVATAMTSVGFQGVLGQLEKAAAAVGLQPAQAQRALEYVATMMGLNVKGLQKIGKAGTAAGQGGAQDGPDPYAEREAAITAREQALENQNIQHFENGVKTSVNTYLAGEMDKALKPAMAALAKQPTFVQESIRKTIVDRTLANIENDKPFKVRFETAELQGSRDPQHAEKLVNLMKSRIGEELPRVASSVLKEAGLAIVNANTARLNVKQSAAAKKEPPLSAGPGRVTKPVQAGKGNATRTNGGAKTGGDYNQYADNALKEFIDGV